MNCTEAKSLLDAFLDAELDARTNFAIQQHLDHCRDCGTMFQAAATEQQRLARALRSTPRTHSLWAAIEARVAGVTATNRTSDRATQPQSDCGWRFWLWPDPRCYAGLAAIWLLLLAAHLTSRDHDPHRDTIATRIPPESGPVMAEQRRLFTELLGSSAPGHTETSGPRSRIQSGQPLSDRAA
jgi:hypothetical protein